MTQIYIGGVNKEGATVGMENRQNEKMNTYLKNIIVLMLT